MTDPSKDAGFQWWHQPRMSWFVYRFIVFLCVVSIILLLMRAREESRYSVVFEVKENTTRVHLFRLLWREGFWTLSTQEYESIAPGLLDYLDRPRDGVHSLLPLFARARNAIPESHQGVATVSLGVTETFHRQLANDDNRVQDLFARINRTLRSSSFHNAFVVSINATDEAAYTWSAISLLKKTSGARVAVLNLGRYRCQICFVPNMTDPNMSFVRFQKNVGLYVKDYNRLGIDHTRAGVTREAGAHVCDSKIAHDHRFRLCQNAIREYLIGVGVDPMPDLQTKEIYVRGFFFEFAVYGGLIQEHENRQTIKVEYIGSQAEAACKDRRYRTPSICFELTYMYTLFTQSYRIGDERELRFVRRIENGSASWTLGLAIAHVYD